MHAPRGYLRRALRPQAYFEPVFAAVGSMRSQSNLAVAPSAPPTVKATRTPRFQGGKEGTLFPPRRGLERRRGARARSGSLVDRRPAVFIPAHLIQQSLASDINGVLRLISVIEKKITPLGVGHDAAVAGTFPLQVAGENWVGRIFFPWPEKSFGARHAECVIAAESAAAGAGVKKLPIAQSGRVGNTLPTCCQFTRSRECRMGNNGAHSEVVAVAQ